VNVQTAQWVKINAPGDGDDNFGLGSFATELASGKSGHGPLCSMRGNWFGLSLFFPVKSRSCQMSSGERSLWGGTWEARDRFQMAFLGGPQPVLGVDHD
jgi:hypothetical protein